MIASGMHEGMAGLVCMVVIGLALARAVQFVAWSRSAGAPWAPSHLQTASERRLLLGAALMPLLVVPVAGAGIAFVGYWPDDAWTERRLRQATAYLLREGRARAGPDGRPVFPMASGGPDVLTFRDETGRDHGWFSRRQAEYVLAPDGYGFTLQAWPRGFPPWPYKLLASQASFYVDETGQLRAIRVNESDVRCPPDAPVVATIEPAPPR